MYLEHFGLTAHPFRLTPDSSFLFMSEPHSRAMSYMNYAVWSREGFAVITGEIGSGKTTLIQKLLSELDQNIFVVAKLFQTQLDEVEFLQAILLEFGLNPLEMKKAELLEVLNQFLVSRFRQQKQIVLIVDEAHNLSAQALEEIRILAELDTGKEKMLHVILVGQPQLNEILGQPGMGQLTRRAELHYHIRALSEQEHRDYIRYRLSIVGASDRVLFLPETLPLIYKYTGGVPRLINTLCHTALTCAYAKGLHEITVDVVEATVHELQWLPHAQRIDGRRLQATRGPTDAEVQSTSREQSQALERSQTLAAIVTELGKLKNLSSALESIGKSLEAIEAHLRNLIQKDSAQGRPDAERRQRSG
jgi:general secretion pathway protein A